MYKVIIFDFFGVFCSSIATDWFKKTVNSDPLKLATFQALCTQSDYGNISRDTFNQEAARLSGVSVREVIQGIEAATIINTSLVSYTRTLLGKGFRVACLSNGTRDWTLRIIIDHGLTDLFEEVVLSADLRIVKPYPEIYIHTLKQLGIAASEAIFVDDRKTNVEAAEACGIRSLIFTDTDIFKTAFEDITRRTAQKGK